VVRSRSSSPTSAHRRTESTLSALHDRVALVTGGGRGLGRSHALALAAAGAAVVVNDAGVALDGTDDHTSPADAVVDEIVAAGGRATVDSTDVASVDGGRAAVQAAIDTYGRIDIVVNNAGFAHGGGTASDPDAVGIGRLIDAHLHAALGTTAAAVADMGPRGWGRIVNTVSEAALDARYVASLGYSIAKAALWSATLVAAAELAGSGITVNAVSPGARTRMNAELLDASFRDGASDSLDLDPAHVSHVVRFLCSDAACDVTGRVLHAAGGHVREYTTTRSSRSEIVDRVLGFDG
jgi:NAD(P)-dependent dehydrogenase (short-subunit alcohol dehydrogenase family)